MATPRSFRVCTVGAGYFSHFHHDGWRRRRHADLIAVCDLDRRKAEAMAAAFGVERVFDDAAAMLDACRPDLVDIVTPPATHAALVGLAAERGIDAVCQQPLAPTLEETREMVAGARAAGIRGVLRLDGTGPPVAQAAWRRRARARLWVRGSQFGGDCVHRLQRHVLEHLVDGGPLENDAASYLRNLEIEEAVYRSAAEGPLGHHLI